MNARILIIEEEEQASAQENACLLEAQVKSAEFLVGRTTVAECLGYLKKALVLGEAPEVVIFGPTVQAPLALARQVRASLRNEHFIFVPDPKQVTELERQLSRAPMIGSAWSLAKLEDSSLTKQIADAIQTTQRRVRLRTTLDRANIQINTPKTVDSADYRRMAVSEHYLANLLTQAQDVIVSLDASQRIMFLSAGAAKLARIGPGEGPGVPLKATKLWSEEIPPYLDRVRTAQQALTAELTLTIGQSTILMEALFSAVRNDSGEFIGTSLFMRDVTARNRQLETERLARAEAEAVSKLKDDFLTTLSHELRTPLNSILGWSQLLRMQGLPEQKRIDGVATIERNARQQAKLIEDLLDISSIITGKFRLQLQPVGLRAIVESAVESARPAALQKGLALTVTSVVENDIVSGDVHRLSQVMNNLLSNAIKFTPSPGSIDVSIVRADSALRVSVSDTGEGLDKAFLPHIFGRFRQANSSITKKQGGLGLGLSIVKQLVEMHGGSVTASSGGPGLGTTFSFVLPLADTKPQEISTFGVLDVNASAVPALEGVRILIVDDEADAREMVAFLFQKYGAETKTASSAAEALQVIEGFNPQLLISDIAMPDVDGYELLKAIRAGVPNGKNLPAIALTAFADASNREKALITGFQNHLGKPLNMAELLALAASMVNSTSSPS